MNRRGHPSNHGRSRGGRLALVVLWATACLVQPLPLHPAGEAADAPGLVSDLIAAQTRLIERTREYRTSLEAVLALEETEAARVDARAHKRRELFERGLVSRREAEESEALAKASRAKVEETRKRIAEADALTSETLAAMEVAKMPKSAPGEMVATSTVIRYQGAVDLAPADIANLAVFFVEQFGRPLPVSALGQTPVHDRLGLDHRHAVDVAVHPDSDEGRVLIEYLRRERIPFLAFRGPVAGASTGAHVHVGQVSPRLIPVKAVGR